MFWFQVIFEILVCVWMFFFVYILVGVSYYIEYYFVIQVVYLFILIFYISVVQFFDNFDRCLCYLSICIEDMGGVELGFILVVWFLFFIFFLSLWFVYSLVYLQFVIVLLDQLINFYCQFFDVFFFLNFG